MAEAPSPLRGAMVAPSLPPQPPEPFASNLAVEVRASSRGFQPAAKRIKGAEERGLKGPKRVNGEGGGSNRRQPPPSPHIPVAPTAVAHGSPAVWSFAAFSSAAAAGGTSSSAAGGSLVFPPQLPHKLLLPPPSSHSHHCLAAGVDGGGGKIKRPKEKRDKDKKKLAGLPLVGAAVAGGAGGGLSAVGREENGEVKLFPQQQQQHHCQEGSGAEQQPKCYTVAGWDSQNSSGKKKTDNWGSSEKRRQNLASKGGKWTRAS